MTPFRAAAGVVDRLTGLPLPDDITLFAIALCRKPNLDGGYEPSDVVSSAPVAVHFRLDRQELQNSSTVRIPLIEGSWPDLYLQLHDSEGAPMAKGAVAFGSAAEGWIEASPEVIAISSRRRS